MKNLMNFPLYSGCLDACGGPEALERLLDRLGLDGLEVVWGEENYVNQIPERRCIGYHMMFYPDWLDFWQGDEKALLRKFGSRAAWQAFYGGSCRADMVAAYRRDLARAEALGAEYVVFHASDVSVEEGYTYRWLHGDGEVVDAAAELIGLVLDGREPPFAVLVENQWWPGLTFMDRELTKRMLDAIPCKNKGLLLDTGHLLNTNPGLESQRAGADYIKRVLGGLDELVYEIRGVHLHQGISGAYVRENTGFLPPLPEDYMARFAESYGHIQRIDRHEAWTDRAVRDVIAEIAPQWLTHELAAPTFAAKLQALETQLSILK